MERQALDLLRYERMLWDLGLDLVAGVDEVGRGCLAGPVVAAAVILPRDRTSLQGLSGVRDSKSLTSQARARLEKEIRLRALSLAISQVEPPEIDRINILNASLKAMAQAVNGLDHRPNVILVDGNQFIPHTIPQKVIIKGDSLSLTIAAASIVAKVFRDDLMKRMDREFPGYQFGRHKGYATRRHKEALRIYGPCAIHRKSFSGVKEYLDKNRDLP